MLRKNERFGPDLTVHFHRLLLSTLRRIMHQANSVKHYGQSILRTLLKEQAGKCALCHEPLTEQTGMNAHHIEEKHLGGAYTLENLVILHPFCHIQVHQNNIPLKSPVLARKASHKPRSFAGA